jgi:hypothetical protein
VVPDGCADISLRSRVFVPAHVSAELTDRRELGLYLNRLQIDGADVALDDDAACAAGWHRYEAREDGPGRRWTDGAAKLPAGARLVVIDYAGRGAYWADSEDNVVALFG